ncbi:MAG: hypothetical protein M1833_005475 [Piccolia ochrophora]|nr:MAG: hypothetical protein M1833_005475 [Piccolia ochrophora]
MATPTDKALRMSYRIGRGEQGVLTFEPYKSELLPLWRFKTPDVARKSSQELWQRFEDYGSHDDFVGMDMTRKFIQMGMTRAKRYANHAGGRKYSKDTGEQLARSSSHKDHADKLEASEIFRAKWNDCRSHDGYLRLKDQFLEEQKQYLAEQKAHSQSHAAST